MRPGRLSGPVAVVLLLLLLAPTACGDQEKDYCTALESDQTMFAEMAEDTDGLALLQHRTRLHALAEKAPDDLDDEWQTFLGAIDGFSSTLADLDVTPDEFVDGRPPSGLSAADRTRIADAASELSSQDVVEAANGIEQQAKDVCKLQLGL
jgi:hypothetical protein